MIIIKAVILAAGKGTRLGTSYPKPLTVLFDGKSIMQHQIDSLLKFIEKENIIVVVGYQKEKIMDSFPDFIYIYNEQFETTNTAKSLLKALSIIKDEDVLWLNGDVFFEEKVISKVIDCSRTCMVVNNGSVGKEEVKYVTGVDGLISVVSKEINNGLGEALGINLVVKNDLSLLTKCLDVCDNYDYFEKAIEYGIKKGMKVYPVDITGLICHEIDFPEDLRIVNNYLINKIISFP